METGLVVCPVNRKDSLRTITQKARSQRGQIPSHLSRPLTWKDHISERNEGAGQPCTILWSFLCLICSVWEPSVSLITPWQGQGLPFESSGLTLNFD
jgi:hypothetical protein